MEGARSSAELVARCAEQRGGPGAASGEPPSLPRPTTPHLEDRVGHSTRRGVGHLRGGGGVEAEWG